MPQQRAVSLSKRKASSDSEGEKPVGSKQAKAKKAKVAAPATNPAAEQNALAPNGQPTNKVLPVKISFPARAENATRIASWNICSLASSQKKVRLTTTDTAQFYGG
jgi:AP endonuclease 1